MKARLEVPKSLFYMTGFIAITSSQSVESCTECFNHSLPDTQNYTPTYPHTLGMAGLSRQEFVTVSFSGTVPSVSWASMHTIIASI